MIENKEKTTRTNKEMEAENNKVIELKVNGSSYKLFLPNLETDYIQKKIYNEKCPYELQLLQDIRNRLSSDDLVIDVGANVGNHTLYLACLASCHVVAFEPNAGLADAIRTSAEMNGLTDLVTVYAFGVGKQSEYGFFSQEIPDNLGAQSISLGDGPIRIVSLDSIKFEYPVKVIKIDVEGMEPDVLEGAKALLLKDRPIVYVECRTEDEFRIVNNKLDQIQYCYWDTFNVTPTHLFLPREHVSLENRLAQIQVKAALNEYKESQHVLKLTSELEKAREKYRTISEKSAILKKDLIESNQKYREANDRIDQLKVNLAESNRKQLEANKRIDELKTDLAESNRKQLEANKRSDQLKSNLDEANRKYREANELIDSFKERLTAEQESARTKINALQLQNKTHQKSLLTIRSGVAFQLGYAIVSAGRSWEGFVRFPASLWRIFKQVVRIIFNRPNKAVMVLDVKKHEVDHRHVQKQTAKVESLPLPQQETHAVKFTLPDNRSSLKVACIMDEFSYNSFKSECNLNQITPNDWHSELETFQPELLFIESAWRGKDELWGYKVSHNSAELQDIVAWCRKRKVPTVFWNKEDPIHFQTFLNTAKLFDFVFTTDIDCIHRYKAALNHNRVFLLPFACQPAVHNPIELYHRKEAVSFAGAYYVRYPERTRDLESFLNELPAFRPVKIYDRNFGKDDPNYQFPSAYQPYIVGTLPFDKIDLAYKGYQYAINLNSIKQSQTMFARRVFELLGSNTITISNYSRGLRLMLGELVITSDSGSQIVQRLRTLAEDPEIARKFKLAALRKVMSEHTYGQRLNYVLSKVGDTDIPDNDLPAITMMAKVDNQADTDLLIQHFQTQKHPHKKLVIVAPSDIRLKADTRILHLSPDKAAGKTIGDVAGDVNWIAGISNLDYYGPNYLLDIALATFYTRSEIIGKAAYFKTNARNIELVKAEQIYKPAKGLSARRSVVKKNLVADKNLVQWLVSLTDLYMESEKGFGIDPYNYCEQVSSVIPDTFKAKVNDLPSLDTGVSIYQLQKVAEKIPPATNSRSEKILDPERLAQLFGKCRSRNVKIAAEENSLIINSCLKDGRHEYLYANEDSLSEDFITDNELKCFFDVAPGLSVSLVAIFLDKLKQRISHVIFQPNRNDSAQIPFETSYIRWGLRIYSFGQCQVKGLVIGHRNLQPPEIFGKAEYLLVTNQYPSYHDLYRNCFVHTRVKAYMEKELRVDIFRLRKDEPVSWHEFENVDVTTGSQEALRRMITGGSYKCVLVHFLNPDIWEVLKDFVHSKKIVVWVHGAEIHPWYRRKFNFNSNEQIEKAKMESEKRLNFWKNILHSMPKNLYLVFVSKTFADEVMEDLGFELPKAQYRIINNPINTHLFAYNPKPGEQRSKILSIRPYASRQYANDLAVEAILSLAKKPFFDDLEFRLIGNGKLFKHTVAPLNGMKNVIIEQRFLTQPEIAELHKDYGVFLCPTRWDSQGVSRDEAMASGLVPVTSSVAAIPEFVDEQCAMLAPDEDSQALADGIEKLFNDPALFQSMSERCAQRILSQRRQDKIIDEELEFFTGHKYCIKNSSKVYQLINRLMHDSLLQAQKCEIYFDLYKELEKTGNIEEALICLEVCKQLDSNESEDLDERIKKLKESMLSRSGYGLTGVYEDHKNFMRRKLKYMEFPEMVQIETHAVCNAQCWFCPYPGMKRKGEKMSSELFDKLVSDLKIIPEDHRFTISLNHISEPLMDKRCETFIQKINDNLPNASVTIITNGLLLNQKNIQMLAGYSNVASVQVSLNEIDGHTHEKSMGMKNKFEEIAKNLDMLHSTMKKGSIGFKVFLRRVGDHTENDICFVSYCAERWPAFSATSRGRKTFLCQMNFDSYGQETTENYFHPKVPIVGCTQWYHLVISASGKVAACCFDGQVQWPIGDISSDGIMDIYNSEAFRSLRENCWTRLEANRPCNACDIHWGAESVIAEFNYTTNC